VRRLLAALLAGSLVLAYAGAATAAPTRNPHVNTWEIVCPGEPAFTVVAKGVPGWDTDTLTGDVPFLLMSYELSFWEGGIQVEGPYINPAPPGLLASGQLTDPPCLIHLPGGSRTTFDVEITNARFLDR
jgi:hypothetical protein